MRQVTAALSYRFGDADSRCFAAPVLWTCVFLCAGVLISVVFAVLAVKVTVGIFVASVFGLRVLVLTFPRLATRESKKGPSLAMTGAVRGMVALSCFEEMIASWVGLSTFD